MKKNKNFFVYKIYYGDELVYVGRTHQELQNRIRGHLFKKPHMKVIDINKVSRIEYTRLASEADMFLVELYLICLYKPKLNKDDKPHDELTIHIPSLTFYPWATPLWNRWKQEINSKEYEYLKLTMLKEEKEEGWREKKRTALDSYKAGAITEDEYFDVIEEIREDKAKFKYEIGEITFGEYKEAMGFHEAE